ncbi:hypothetical protein D3C86_2094730 [compost metagenome]
MPSSTAPWLITRSSAVLPKIDSHARVKPSGISSTPMITSRMVRPREMRATNRPTNGAQAIHHAQ